MSDRVIIERSNFGGPWKPHSVGVWAEVNGQRTYVAGYDSVAAQALIDHLHSLPRTRSGATFRLAPLAGYLARRVGR